MHMWCRLIAQAVLALNLLRKLSINPKLSVEYQFNVNFDYNITTLAPVGTAVVAHKSLANKGRGYYMDPEDGT